MTVPEPALPGWAQRLRRSYLAGESSLFLLHGNVRDVQPWERDDGLVVYLPLQDFLQRFLSRTKDILVTYDCSRGLAFPSAAVERRFRSVVSARGRGPAADGPLPRSPGKVLPLLEALITDASQSSAVVLDYVETIVPSAELAFLSDEDKAALVTLQRWSYDPALLRSDNLVILVAEQFSDVNRRVIAMPQVAAVEIPLPSEGDRLAFIRRQDLAHVPMELTDEQLARQTAGLSLVQVRGILRRARQSGEPVSYRSVVARKKAIIEQECHGLVELVEPEHDFRHVGGLDRIKRDLLDIAASIREGRRHQVPMGLIFVGPMGTGKTFLAEAFAAESGLTCLKFKNFREKWVGSTEANLEKILQVVEALGYVLLIIDEADRSLAQGSEGDGGTSSRVIARLKEFLSDTSHRGRVVVLLMTNRPDKLDADLKRPGRFDVKVPFFYPEDEAERIAILEALLRRHELSLAPGTELGPTASATAGSPAAELESVVLAASSHAAREGAPHIRAEDLEAAVHDVIPSRDVRMLEYMEMLAVFEATNRRMLPERYRGWSTEQVLARLDQLRALLGRRLA